MELEIITRNCHSLCKYRFVLFPPVAPHPTPSSSSAPVASLLCSSPSSPNPSDAAAHSGRHGKTSGQVMDGEDRSVDPELDPLFSYPQIPSVFPPPTSHEAAAGVSVGRGSSPAPRVGLHSAAYGRYLTTSNDPAPPGRLGLHVDLGDYEQDVDPILWKVVGSGAPCSS